MNLKTIAVLILFFLSMATQAGTKKGSPPTDSPEKYAAESWLTDFRAAREQTYDSILINDPVKRGLHQQVLMELSKRAEKLFGEPLSKYGYCTKAAIYVNSYWMEVVSLMMNPTHNPHIALGGIVGEAWEGSQDYAECRQLIDDIK